MSLIKEANTRRTIGKAVIALEQASDIFRRATKPLLAFAIALGISIALSGRSQAYDTALDKMASDLEIRYALSALPPALRGKAAVYILDPAKGYALARQGSNGLACLVERTAWELADFRNDIYIPLCYDAAGTNAHFKVIMDVAALRAKGMSPMVLKSEIEKRYEDKTYGVPNRPGLSYMVSPIMRTVGPPDMEVHTMTMPHFMFYAPNVTNEDIGALPALGDPESLLNPFIDRQGNDQQSYIIQLVGEAEKAKILAIERTLLDELCAYREILCLSHAKH
ncbi:hypothetical protein AM571_PC00170 (plasmid) [Rhizobium etli 8C-3]|uniref:Uncharacterized protein n=2 Tax=Rhizobium TaxID=379 RepID=A0A1L5PCR8_RHIET|nr:MULTISPECIES: hypothetical protein [Rhizobium]APO77914.1 hypothetical protein AM571_PC00170 [Rhizobium etli 8C-3]TCU41110.1 hypothetical protein EV129_101397 [Rhizobium azibense]